MSLHPALPHGSVMLVLVDIQVRAVNRGRPGPVCGVIAAETGHSDRICVGGVWRPARAGDRGAAQRVGVAAEAGATRAPAVDIHQVAVAVFNRSCKQRYAEET